MLLNFGSGPAYLPLEVTEEASAAIKEYEDSGLSILEIPHRGKLFAAILDEANALAKDLLGLNDDYDILWMQGGGRLQFSMIPMNFLSKNNTAAYIDSGHWSDDALQTAQLYGKVTVLASSKEQHYRFIPEVKEIKEPFDYVHLTSNNTIYGTQFFDFPKTENPLIVDMSSELFSRKLNYHQFDLIYAAAQKNIGPAGVTFVAIKKKLIDQSNGNLPGILSYKAFSEKNSLLNTPPVFSIYCCLLVLRWLKKRGLDTVEKENNEKATLLYNTIDQSSIFKGIVEPNHRSKMNVCFQMENEQMEQAFIEFAAKQNIMGIKGHRSVGGLRIALYNAIKLADVQTLVQVMSDFEKKMA